MAIMKASEAEQVRALQAENREMMNEMHRLIMINTKMQRELRTLCKHREEVVAEADDGVDDLKTELKELDANIAMMKIKCDRMIAVICRHQEGAKSARRMTLQGGYPNMATKATSADEDDNTSSFYSQASTVSSSSSVSSPTTSPSPSPVSYRMQRRASSAKPPPMIISSPSPEMDRESIMMQITRSVKKSNALPPVYRSQDSSSSTGSSSSQSEPHAPMLAYKANSMLRSTQSHLNNFRRRSGPVRKYQETAVL